MWRRYHTIIKNREELLSHGSTTGRGIALDIIEFTLKAIDTYELVKNTVYFEEDKLIVGQHKYDLSKIRTVYVVGAGKGSIRMAQALEDILGSRIKKGVIIEKLSQGRHLKTISVVEAGHPIPDVEGMKGASEIREIAESAKKGDLVFVCVTGGCTALMSLPSEGISLEDEKGLTNLLLRSGATIDEINAVRKHTSAINGGRLARYIHPATVISLIVVDEVAGLPWGPTVPDTTTFADAVSVLKKYYLWEKVPDPIRKHLERAEPKEETPKFADFKREGIRVYNLVLADSETICKVAKKRAEKLGFKSMLLSTLMEGESREVGIALAGIAKEVDKKHRRSSSPHVLIVGGETTVTIVGEPGEGGRNQEFALAASLKIEGRNRIVIASIGTDGTDGPTDIAGGIVDGYTLERAREKGIDVFENLKAHNSSYVFRKLGDAIFTGPTGTNVMDLQIMVVT